MSGETSLFQPQRVVVQAEDSGLRLDQFVSRVIPDQSRSLISVAIHGGSVLVGREQKKGSYRLKIGDEVEILSFYRDDESALIAEAVDFTILFEDEYLLFVNKPPGLVVHPGSGNTRGTLVHGLLYHYSDLAGVGDVDRPGIVHRLDKDTSGVMVVAKTPQVHRALVEIFKNHQLSKVYLALVCGFPTETRGRIVTNIGRHPVNRQKMAVVDKGGRFAASNWSVVERFARYTLLRVEIETGRTHQIRVHLAHIGYPVAGDMVYGGSRGKALSEIFPRQMLHAYELKFIHPVTAQECHIIAPLYGDMKNAVEFLREGGGV